MPRRTRLVDMVPVFAVVLLVGGGIASAASPALSIILPRGVQRGTEQVLTFSGARLADAEEIFFYEPGLQVTKIEPKGANQLKVHVKISPTCRLGEHTAQVRTKSGISEYRTFYVGALPAVDEKEPNSEFEKPQPIKLNVTVQGIVQREDVDYYVVEAKKGQRITAEVEGMRLGSTLFDPYVAILDSKRFELSAADDTPLVWQDGVASVVAPADGKYVVQIRESAYGGNGNCRYRLHVGTFPRPTAVYPAGGKIGEKTTVRFLGDVAGELKQTITPPNEPPDRYGLFAQDAGGIAPSPNPFRPFPHGNVLETEPNDTLKQATPAELPLAFNGIISKPGDVDFFRFKATKGQVYEIECYGRRIRSPLDSVMNLYYANGRSIAGNDDSRGPDSYIRFRAPANGEYVLRMTDQLSRGAVNFTYRIEITPVTPSLTLAIPRVTRYTQYRQTIFVPRGNRFATLVSAARSNFSGELVLDGNNLPKGIKMIAQPMASNLSVMPVVFEAAADAPLSGRLIDFTAHPADAKLKIRGGFRNTADMIRGGPGQSIYWRKNVRQLAVAVVEELPFRLEIVQPKVPLVRNGSMQLKVIAHRKKGFDAAINVQFPFRPPGIGAASSVNIPKGKNEVAYPLNANSGAQIRKWPIYVIGSANVNGTAWVSSQLATLDVTDSYVQFVMARTAVEQGKETEIICKIQMKHPFSGKAKVRLLGLPNKVTAPELEITTATKELVFPVKTDVKSPPGRHRNVFCQVIVTENGEPIVHRRVGGTELRIDRPLPAPKKKPVKKPIKKVATKKPAKKPAVRRLTRLEKLRLEAKKRSDAARSGKK